MKRAILLLFLPLLAIADPGTATRYLMDEPASLMDLGITRAQIFLEGIKDLMKYQYRNASGGIDSNMTVSVDYDYEGDKVDIIIAVTPLTTEKAETGCRALVTGMDSVFQVAIAQSFFHHGYEAASQPDNLFEKLERRVDVTCDVYGKDSNRHIMTVRSNLASDEIVVTKEGE